jgi:ubiquitin-protein ligase
MHRLMKELEKHNKDPQILYLAPKDENFFEWLAVINGLPDTPYNGGFFQLEIKIGKGA